MESFSMIGVRGEHFMTRHLLQSKPDCTQQMYETCFSKCPPQIPGPPPPPPSLIGYKRTWCKGHDLPWTCNNTNTGPFINGDNPRLSQNVVQSTELPDHSVAIAVGVTVPLVIICVLVILIVLFVLRRRRAAEEKKTDNTYNLGYLNNKPQAPSWTDNDGTEVTAEDGSEIFYQVDRSAISAGINGGANHRAVPDIINSSNGTLRRSGSATSQVPLLASPEILAARSRRRTGGARTISEGPDGEESDLGSPPYTRYGAGDRSPNQFANEPRGAARNVGNGYMTYSPNTKSHPSLYNGAEHGTTVRTPKATNRQRSFSGADRSRPRPLRNPPGGAASAANIQRSDSMTLNRGAAGGRENYRNNWDNFDEVTATMRKNKNRPARELVLGTDSFIESFTSPEPEEATSVDQLGLPGRNPMLAGFYDEGEDMGDYGEEETAFGDPMFDSDFMNCMDNPSAYEDDQQDHSPRFYESQSPSGRSITRSPQGPPAYDDLMLSNRNQAVSLSTAPTLDIRGRRDRISEYDSEASVEV